MPDTRRLFFALWPDPATRQGIVERRSLLARPSRRQVPDHNLHLTLLFVGDQPAGQVGAIEAAADAIAPEPFSLCLDRFGWFAGARVVWLGGEAPAPARGLADALGQAMTGLGLAFDRRPFRPHVTLYRQVRSRPELPLPPPLAWSPKELVLIESVRGQPYQVLRSWPVG